MGWGGLGLVYNVLKTGVLFFVILVGLLVSLHNIHRNHFQPQLLQSSKLMIVRKLEGCADEIEELRNTCDAQWLDQLLHIPVWRSTSVGRYSEMPGWSRRSTHCTFSQ